MKMIRSVANATITSLKSQEYRKFVANQAKEKVQELIGEQVIDLGQRAANYASSSLDKVANNYNTAMPRNMSQEFTAFNNSVSTNTTSKKY